MKLFYAGLIVTVDIKVGAQAVVFFTAHMVTQVLHNEDHSIDKAETQHANIC